MGNSLKPTRVDRYVSLRHWLLKTPAYVSLTPAARAIYVALAFRYNGANNGRLAMSMRDAARECRISKNTAPRAIRELIDKGFVERKKAGGFSRKDPHAAEYLLTEYRDDVDQRAPTKAFMAWRPKSEPDTN